MNQHGAQSKCARFNNKTTKNFYGGLMHNQTYLYLIDVHYSAALDLPRKKVVWYCLDISLSQLKMGYMFVFSAKIDVLVHNKKTSTFFVFE